ncbi:unnamed protein product [Acanthosepion pharaonis]|uniref:small monomeric GTPase n=1 Tax=Acanthosepion pharaonis TaxID=158019 RepID=A0A812E3C1_ACAPH|nr:unnamed protein product [Sepia pharaonis]
MGVRSRPFRVVVLGQNGVGKSAFIVRYLTRRFIGEYDPNLEKVYTNSRNIDGDLIMMEILDTARQEECLMLEQNLKWAEAYVLMYAVTDRCSFNECSRLKFLISNYTKKQRRSSVSVPEGNCLPVALVGNQTDRIYDRMVSEEEGRLKAAELSCMGFYEMSVRESIDDVVAVFENLYLYCRKPKKFRSRQKQSGSDLPPIVSLSTGAPPPGMSLPDVLPQTEVFKRRKRALQTIS